MPRAAGFATPGPTEPAASAILRSGYPLEKAHWRSSIRPVHHVKVENPTCASPPSNITWRPRKSAANREGVKREKKTKRGRKLKHAACSVNLTHGQLSRKSDSDLRRLEFAYMIHIDSRTLVRAAINSDMISEASNATSCSRFVTTKIECSYLSGHVSVVDSRLK